jgi:hypothetical protein
VLITLPQGSVSGSSVRLAGVDLRCTVAAGSFSAVTINAATSDLNVTITGDVVATASVNASLFALGSSTHARMTVIWTDGT